MEHKRIEDMTENEFRERFVAFMDTTISAKDIESMNEDALKKLSVLTEKAREFAERNETVSIARVDAISNKSTMCCVTLSIGMQRGLKTIHFSKDLDDTDTYTPLAEMFGIADWVMFKTVSDRRVEIMFYINDVWKLKE